MRKSLAIVLLACATLSAQQTPAPTELPGKPLNVKKSWLIGGNQRFGSMVFDPARSQLLVAYSDSIEAWDLETGLLAGKISSPPLDHRFANSSSNGVVRPPSRITLDNTGQFGYISDGVADRVLVFDRRSFQIVDNIRTAPYPEAIVFEPSSQLLIVLCNDHVPSISERQEADAKQRRDQQRKSGRFTVNSPATTESSSAENESTLTVIDVATRKVLADMQLPVRLGSVSTGGDGQVYMIGAYRKENYLLRLDAIALGDLLLAGPLKQENNVAAKPKDSHPDQQQIMQPSAAKPQGTDAKSALSQAGLGAAGGKRQPEPPKRSDSIWTLSWPNGPYAAANPDQPVRYFPLQQICASPSSLAVDARHLRVFVGCTEKKMAVLNADTGELVTTVPVGPGTTSVAFDFDNGIIYAANAHGEGKLSVIRQHVTDSYAVVENLPALANAKALAVNPGTGDLYIVGDISPDEIAEKKIYPDYGSFELEIIAR